LDSLGVSESPNLFPGLTHCRETELNARAGPGRASVTSLPLSAESSAAEQLIT